MRSVEDPRVLEEVADAGVTLEVCPGSNVALGVYAAAGEVPLREVVAHGIPVALGADDPLLFGTRLVDQYAVARDALGFDDRGLAQLARDAFAASRAPEQVRAEALRDIERWLASPPLGGAPKGSRPVSSRASPTVGLAHELGTPSVAGRRRAGGGGPGGLLLERAGAERGRDDLGQREPDHDGDVPDGDHAS